MAADTSLPLSAISACFEGVIPAVIATASKDGTPNVTHLTRVHLVDDERVAVSNQFFSKTVRNLAENPQACVLLIDPITYHEYRLILRYERTERRGPLFDQLHRDVEAVAALTGMQGVFKLRSADVYRVIEIDDITPAPR
jgi:predicted pyridoxine 5'-phosphate oxidase superfamily flavin-nucleotide-binding protein